MIILSIETSCDETSIAITRDGKEVLANETFSQIKYHQKYGGVVPEIASRKHLEVITYLLEQAFIKTKIKSQDIDLVAVTQGPGLIGSLLLGVNTANTWSYIHQKPLIGVNHLIGHIYSVQIENEIEFPALALIVSGGHTELLYLNNHFDIRKLGTTLDDAVGEVYDKIAKNLNLNYPGGPIIEKLALQGEAVFQFTLPYVKNNNLDFSFSGLKSQIINLINKNRLNLSDKLIYDICASFQKVIIEVLLIKIKRSLKKFPTKNLILVGGVASNLSLQKKFLQEFSNLRLLIPSLKFCTDQAAMIGIAAYYQYKFRKPQELYNYNLTGLADLTSFF
ncbi:MAG: tRNA (adenosine(37)-N6)-threonylcarbamoyltransferase complex transferase subunit TsaD [Pigeon pea little leaf phytoplasma]|uniref:tRNA N6-adenosine threonylcarbamoyltransferase n=1 Tax=Candidatus Phytoplasma fabacearum TaxID=2982628 RepID=A0ABU8ZSK8_9MOLU|nr:tRNA (adenosine(37)-N6)-threonylcarbamoyltransferase complex transferase subunit TsaD ['Bituminaria bituminosa' little leaf phytoplasma]MDV3154300.1 tRNA (adenosine(37)-N6)-threonylcarbamoyltransferase complex transferase subunit TsaD [Pigeon pea little leaf phytoplasma]MDO7983701.1 tRNA (adenosine(37)-N6)-threonylcarbamoyltransferase complex transferase subunit TsaD ['Bituminaria bituminosa' little leaf phytoplasma]MDO8023973.1 tRNA (adenosine(37)-N6)-threonylcarbamoyltransferase complex tra